MKPLRVTRVTLTRRTLGIYSVTVSARGKVIIARTITDLVNAEILADRLARLHRVALTRVGFPTQNNVREMVEREILSGILVPLENEDCGCPIYRVATGKVSEYMPASDYVCPHTADCAEYGATREEVVRI